MKEWKTDPVRILVKGPKKIGTKGLVTTKGTSAELKENKTKQTKNAWLNNEH